MKYILPALGIVAGALFASALGLGLAALVVYFMVGAVSR